MKKVILIHPILGFWEERENYEPEVSIPLNLLAISRFISKDYKICIIDQRVNHKRWREMVEKELDDSTLCVAITCMTGGAIKNALEAAKLVKTLSKDTPIVFGGVHPTLLPEQTLKNRYIDFIVRGEGEFTFNELVRAIDKKSKDFSKIKGLSYKKGSKTFHNQDREMCDMDELPDIDYELTELTKYSGFLKDNKGNRRLDVETSRGCPFRCKYCYNQKFNRGKWRAMSASKVIAFLSRLIDRYQVTEFFFMDDDFFVDKKRAVIIFEEMIKLMEKSGRKISLKFQGMRVDQVLNYGEDFLKLMVKTGVDLMLVGIDATSQKMLDLVSKDLTINQILIANRMLAKYPIRVYYNFMMGYPGEEIKDLKSGTKLAIKLMDDNPYVSPTFFSIYQPYPGTKMYDLCVNKGFKEPKTLEEWSEMDWDKYNLPFISRKRKVLLEKIHMLAYTLRIRKNSKMTKLNPKLRMLARAYRHIVRFRFMHFFFGLYFEGYLKDKFIKI
jgi:radical SAM superfamily enzyme YgiQ (UPF0313 family)